MKIRDNHSQSDTVPKKITTAELAEILRVSSQSLRAGFCRKGHYLGLIPLKLASGRLLWDADEVRSLLKGEVL